MALRTSTLVIIQMKSEQTLHKLMSAFRGIVAPHRLVGYQADYMPMAYFGTFSGSSKLNASISFLPSVNIVLTSDKSLWTRCPIVELR